IVDPADYAAVMEDMRAGQGATTLQTRRRLATKAFARTSAYDSAISRWLQAVPSPVGGGVFLSTLTLSATLKQPLHYGENPHQKAAFYATGNASPSLATA